MIPSVTLVVNASRGIWATTPGGKWYEYPQREFEFYDDPVDDATGKVEVKLDSNWGKNGRVKIRQLDPLPLSVLAVIPRLTVGDSDDRCSNCSRYRRASSDDFAGCSSG